ncbi:hypothetical protein J6590_022941 [Homalodisca vitripennis]|nr:hypothetical protein J6590_022941 [Homalodisca vitripennis]
MAGTHDQCDVMEVSQQPRHVLQGDHIYALPHPRTDRVQAGASDLSSQQVFLKQSRSHVFRKTIKVVCLLMVIATVLVSICFGVYSVLEGTLDEASTRTTDGYQTPEYTTVSNMSTTSSTSATVTVNSSIIEP